MKSFANQGTTRDCLNVGRDIAREGFYYLNIPSTWGKLQPTF